MGGGIDGREERPVPSFAQRDTQGPIGHVFRHRTAEPPVEVAHVGGYWRVRRLGHGEAHELVIVLLA